MKLKDLVSYLDEYLGINDISDYSWNGLQVQGKSEVKKIVCAVDSGCLTFEEDADLIIVHHGLFWKSIDPSIKGLNLERIRMLMDKDSSLYACHLPLDRHREIGNNALLLKLIGAKITDEFHFSDGKNISWIGETDSTLSEIVSSINKGLNTESKVLSFGKERIKKVAVCSGGPGIGIFAEALDAGVDLYIAGEPCDFYHLAKDAKVNVIFAGHHASEILGVKELAKILKEKFSLDVVFKDIPTGL